MPIEFPCPNCSAVLRTPDEAAGKKARCPQCGTIADVPLGSVQQAPSLVPETPAGDPTVGMESPFGAPETPAFESPFGDQPAPAKPQAMGADPANPYAPPEALSMDADRMPGGAPGEMRHSQIEFGNVFNTAWGIFTENLGPCVIVGLVMLGFGFAMGVIGQIGGMAAQMTGEISAVIAFQGFDIILRTLVQTWIQLGVLYFAIKMVRTRQATVSDFFAVGPYFLRALVVGILVAMICGAVALVCMAPFGGLLAYLYSSGGQAAIEDNMPAVVIAGVIGGFVALVVCTWISLRLALTSAFIVDRNAGIVESMQLSDTYMQGNKLTAFLLGLVLAFAGGMFVCVTCGIGSIFFYPFGGMVGAVIYLMATGQDFPKPNR